MAIEIPGSNLMPSAGVAPTEAVRVPAQAPAETPAPALDQPTTTPSSLGRLGQDTDELLGKLRVMEVAQNTVPPSVDEIRTLNDTLKKENLSASGAPSSDDPNGLRFRRTADAVQDFTANRLPNITDPGELRQVRQELEHLRGQVQGRAGTFSSNGNNYKPSLDNNNKAQSAIADAMKAVDARLPGGAPVHVKNDLPQGKGFNGVEIRERGNPNAKPITIRPGEACSLELDPAKKYDITATAKGEAHTAPLELPKTGDLSLFEAASKAFKTR